MRKFEGKLSGLIVCAVLALVAVSLPRPAAGQNPGARQNIALTPPEERQLPASDCKFTRPLHALIPACNQLLLANPKNPDAHALIGNAYRRLGQWWLAATHLDAAINIEPTHAFALSRRVTLNALRGRGFLVRPDNERIRANETVTAADFEARALAFMIERNRAAALATFSAGLERNPHDAGLLAGRAIVYGLDNKVREAIADAEMLVTTHPNYAYGHQVLGIVLAMGRQFGPAEAEFDASVRLDQDDPNTYVERAAIRFRLGRLPEAEEDLSSALALSQTPACAYALRAALRAERFDNAAAARDFDDVFRLLPADELPNQVKTVQFHCVGQGAEANYFHGLWNLVQIIPSKIASAYASRASSRIEMGLYSDGVVDATRAIAFASPPNSKLHSDRALGYFRLGRLQEALADATKAIELAMPPSADLFTRRADILVALGEPDKARADRERADAWRNGLSTRPTGPSASATPIASPPSTSVATPIANQSEARTTAGASLSASPSQPTKKPIADSNVELVAAFASVDALTRQGKHALAIIALDKLISEHPGNAFAYTKRALAYANTKDFKRGLIDADKALSIEPDGVNGLGTRCAVYGMSKDFGMALKDCNRLIEVGVKTAAKYALRAAIYVDMHAYDSAIADLSTAISLGPNGQETRFQRAVTYLRLRKIEEAMNDFKFVMEAEPGHVATIQILRQLRESESDPPTLSVKQYRLADPTCGDKCPEWISLEGTIDVGSSIRFFGVLSRLGDRRLPIFINSPGGLIQTSYAIGRLIKSRKLDVFVTRTEAAACPGSPAACQKATQQGIQFGKPRGKLARCASACVNILAAGAVRSLGPGSLIGVHQGAIVKKIDEKRNLIDTRIPETAYVQMKDYLEEMGVNPALMNKLMSASFFNIYWLSRPDMLSTNLLTGTISGERLLTGGEQDEAMPTSAQVEALFAKIQAAQSAPQPKY